MGTTTEKLQKILDTKNAIKQSIINKGGNIDNTTPFSQYSNAIDNLSIILAVSSLPTASAENVNTIFLYNGELYICKEV